MELKIINQKGKETSRKAILSDEIYAIEPNEHVVYLEVKRHLAAKRQGTHKTKGRSEIKGSTRKIKKQKGTGTARAGSIKNPLFKGGGRVFGPIPKMYNHKINKSTRKLAKKSALSIKAKEGSIIVLEDINWDVPKTKQFYNLLSALNISDKKSLFVLAENNNNVYLSSRNLKSIKVVTKSELNTYDILNSNNLVICEGTIQPIEEMLS